MHRDKSGKEVSEEELKAAKDAEKKAKEWVAPEWAGGVKQQREAEARRAEMAAQAAQPFACSRCVLSIKCRQNSCAARYPVCTLQGHRAWLQTHT